MLRRMGQEQGFAVGILPPVIIEGAPVSSTRIRQLISEGRVEAAARLMGRPYSYSGQVVPHRKIGTQLGFPTANVLPGEKVLPAYGVYASRVVMEDHKILPAVSNIGVRPSVEGEHEVTIEAHILQECGNIYGQRIKVELIQHIRPEKAFGSLEELRGQIGRDCHRAVEILEKISI